MSQSVQFIQTTPEALSAAIAAEVARLIQPAPSEEVLTLEEATVFLKYKDQRTTKKLVREGKLIARGLGSDMRFLKSECLAALKIIDSRK